VRILFISHPDIGLIGGGMPNQIKNTAEALRQIGVDVAFYDPWTNQIDSVDVCHFFGNSAAMYPIFTKVQEKKKPIVLSPIFNFNYGGITWRQRKLLVRLSSLRGFFTGYRLIKKMLEESQNVLPLNDEELEKLSKVFNVHTDNFTIVPIGMNKKYLSGDSALFHKKYGMSGFILNVATMQPTKNQLTLIKAIKELPYKLVLIGPTLEAHQRYREECKAAAGENVYFIGEVDDEMLISAYAAARVFVLPSFSEIMPACLYEAAMAGCKIIVSKKVPVSANIINHVKTADPNKPEAFRKLITTTMETEPDACLREIVSSLPDWKSVAHTLLHIYTDILH
jgi:glycosyltransferase involved in cell wall biosynthesis